jgi:hypothetical protein
MSHARLIALASVALLGLGIATALEAERRLVARVANGLWS